MTIDFLKFVFIKFLKGKVSSFFLLIFSSILLMRIVGSCTIERENGFDFLGPHPQGVVSNLLALFPLGNIDTNHLDRAGEYSKSHNRLSIYTNKYRMNNERTAWIKNKKTDEIRLAQIAKNFFEEYRKQKEVGKNYILWISGHAHNFPINMDSCPINIVTANDMGIGSLILTTGNAKTMNDFIGYDILQATTEPIFEFKCKDFSFFKKMTIIEIIIIFTLILGKLVVNKRFNN